MLGDAVIWILPLVASCHGAVLSGHARPARDNAAWPDVGAGGSVGPLAKSGYVRMPVSRHKFNGTRGSRRGWHWSSPPGVQGFPPPPPCSWASSSLQNTTSTNPQTVSVRPTLQPELPGQSTAPWPSFPTPSFSVSAGPTSSAFNSSNLTTVTRPGPTASSSVSTTARSLALRGSQADRRWGWSSLEELGGIAYIIERKSPYPYIEPGRRL